MTTNIFENIGIVDAYIALVDNEKKTSLKTFNTGQEEDGITIVFPVFYGRDHSSFPNVSLKDPSEFKATLAYIQKTLSIVDQVQSQVRVFNDQEGTNYRVMQGYEDRSGNRFFPYSDDSTMQIRITYVATSGIGSQEATDQFVRFSRICLDGSRKDLSQLDELVKALSVVR